MASRVETTILRLQEKVSGPAKVAESALSRLEAQALKSQKAVASLGSTLAGVGKQVKGLYSKGLFSGLAAAVKGTFSRTPKAAAPKAPKAPKVSTPKAPKVPAKPKMPGAPVPKGAGVKDSIKGLDQLNVATAGAFSKQISFAKSLMSVGPEAAAVAVAVALLTSAVGALSAVVGKGLSASAEYRTELLELRTLFASIPQASGGTVIWAQQLQESIRGISASSANSRAEITGMATQLVNAGFRGVELTKALTGMDLAQAAGGTKLAQRFMREAQMARLQGKSVDALTAKYKKQWGALADAKALTFSTQLSKLWDKITFLFSGADIDPLLRAIQSVFSLFGEGSKSAMSLKQTITKVVEAVIGCFLDFGIAVLKTYLALRTLYRKSETFGMVLGGLRLMLGIMTAAFIVLGGVAVTAIALMLLPIALMAVAIVGLMTLIANWSQIWGKATEWVGKKFQELKDWFDTIQWTEVGANIINGIVNGILGIGHKIADTLRGLLKGSVSAAKDAIDSHSPSKLFSLQVGKPISQGIAVGVQQSAPQAMASVSCLMSGVADLGLGASGIGDIGGGISDFLSSAVSGIGDAVGSIGGSLSSGIQGISLGASMPSVSASFGTGAGESSLASSAASSGGDRPITFTNCTFGSVSESDIRAMLHRALEAEAQGAI